VSERNEIPPKRNYKWPWFVLAAILLFVVLAVLWMSFAVHREKQERDFNAPLPNNPARQ
jgi:bacteriorhodopsin